MVSSDLGHNQGHNLEPESPNSLESRSSSGVERLIRNQPTEAAEPPNPLTSNATDTASGGLKRPRGADLGHNPGHSEADRLKARLRSKVVVDLAGCWIWQGAISPAGYGAIRANGRKRDAHRLTYELYFGNVPRSRVVCHRCHNPACVNPEHLYLGTRAQNLADAERAGRGCQNRLTPDQVASIRRSKGDAVKVAARFKVGVSTVYKIRGGRTHTA